MIPNWAKWLIAIIAPVAFLAGLTGRFEHFGWYELIVVTVVVAFISAVLWHAKNKTEGL